MVRARPGGDDDPGGDGRHQPLGRRRAPGCRWVSAALRVATCAGLAWLALGLTACDPSQRLLFLDSRTGVADSDARPDAGVEDTPTAPDAGTDDDADSDIALDPDVAFEWTQTVSGGGECAAGDYIGTFECGSGGTVVLSGVAAFTLVPGTSETSLLISPGRLDLVDPNAPVEDGPLSVSLRAGLAGEMDCANDRFAAVATPAQTPMLPLPLGFFAPIAATLDGVLARRAQELVGTITIAGGLASCSGPWTARRAP